MVPGRRALRVLLDHEIVVRSRQGMTLKQSSRPAPSYAGPRPFRYAGRPSLRDDRQPTGAKHRGPPLEERGTSRMSCDASVVLMTVLWS